MTASDELRRLARAPEPRHPQGTEHLLTGDGPGADRGPVEPGSKRGKLPAGGAAVVPATSAAGSVTAPSAKAQDAAEDAAEDDAEDDAEEEDVPDTLEIDREVLAAAVAAVSPSLVVDLTDEALARPRPRPAPRSPSPVPAEQAESVGPSLLTGTGLAAGAPGVAPTEQDVSSGERAASWSRRWSVAMVGLDAVAVTAAWAAFCLLARPRTPELAVLAAAAGVPGWLLVVRACGGYDRRLIGVGRDEIRRVADAAVRYAALVALAAVLARPGAARSLVTLLLPALLAAAVAVRGPARYLLRRRRRGGRAVHRVLVVGDPAAAEGLTRRLSGRQARGVAVVGSCPTAAEGSGAAHRLAYVPAAVRFADADTVWLTAAAAADPDAVRRLAWSLEGTGVDLLLGCAPAEVAARRLGVRTVAGMPVLQVAQGGYPGASALVRSLLDRVTAGALMIVLAPLLLAVAVAVRFEDRGPSFYRQVRIGRAGRPFTMYKFRTMHAGADRLLDGLRERNDHRDDDADGGVLFKLREDPRVTGIGRWLRRSSIDELPQLFNVLRGDMSLVGPRPPLPGEVERYPDDVHRRLLVTPGITGLWQVSGRSDLKWEETVRLDLYYVENRSPSLDGAILCRTARAVLTGEGAR